MFRAAVNVSDVGKVNDANARRSDFIADGTIYHLYKQGMDPSPESVKADFDAFEADFTGYVTKTIGTAPDPLFNPVGVDDAGNAVFSTPQLFWQATDAAVPNMVAGAYVCTTAGAVRAFIPFPEAVDMTDALSIMTITAYHTGSGGDYADVDS